MSSKERQKPRASVRVCTALVVLTSAAVVGAAPQERASAGSSEVVTLGRVNVIEGTASATINVVVPKKATFDLTLRPYRPEGPTRGMSVTGAGRAVGIALTPPPPVYGLLFGTPRFLVSGRFGECNEPGCDPGRDVVNFQQPFVFPGQAERTRHTLSPGKYRLQLIADGAPVRIRLVLEGLKGRTHITPTAPGSVDLKTPTVRASYLGGPSYFAAGDTFAGGRRGVALSFLSVRGPKGPLYSSYGMCGFYRDEVDVPDSAAYGPQCLARPGQIVTGSWNDARRFDVVFYQGYAQSDLPPTDLSRGHGVWFESPNPTSRVTSHIFTLVLD